MAAVYRNVKTQRKVHLYLRTPRMYTGSWIEEEDVITKEVKKVTKGVEASRCSRDIKVDHKFYIPVSDY